MNTSLKFGAAALLAIILSTGVYLSRPSTLEREVATSATMQRPAHLPGDASPAPSSTWRRNNGELRDETRKMNSPAADPGVAAPGQEYQPTALSVSPYRTQIPAASVSITHSSSMAAVRQAGANAGSRAAVHTIAADPFAAVEAPGGESSPTIQMSVPFGATLPATFLDAAMETTPAQVAALDRIAADFVQEATSEDAAEADTTNPPPAAGIKRRPASPRQRWDSAAARANEQYRLLFGVEAYNARTAAAAREALAEQSGKTR